MPTERRIIAYRYRLSINTYKRFVCWEIAHAWCGRSVEGPSRRRGGAKGWRKSQSPTGPGPVPIGPGQAGVNATGVVGHPHSAWPLRLGRTALDSQLEKAFEVVKTL